MYKYKIKMADVHGLVRSVEFASEKRESNEAIMEKLIDADWVSGSDFGQAVNMANIVEIVSITEVDNETR